MIGPQAIREAKQNIARLFVDQCQHGRQTAELPANLVACGQFLGRGAETIAQRGLHGTAAALRVLASSTREEASELVEGLVRYLEVCFGCAAAPTGTAEICADPDTHNVIKIAEVLDALSFVKGSTARTERLRGELAERLLAAKKDNKGWSYWTDAPDAPPHILPTAYAVGGLAKHGYAKEIAGPVRFLWDRLRGPKSEREASDPIVRTLALFVVSSDDVARPGDLQVDPRAIFDSLWARLGPLMAEEIEQNIEYWGGAARRNEYVRVPWQLYLTALSAQFAPVAFASTNTQRRLEAVVAAVNEHEGGFRYPYSGDLISSRTNAILFDLLTFLEPKLQNNFWYQALHSWDRAWTRLSAFLNARWVRVLSVIVAFAFAAWSIYLWASNQSRTPGDLAPDLLASLLIFLMANRKAK